MKLEKLAAIAEIISSIAIVITLVYLAGQTRQMNVQTEQMVIQSQQMTNALLNTSRQELMSADIAMIAALIETPEAWSNIDKPFSELSPVEQGQALNVYAAAFRTREYAWFQYNNGTLDEAALRSYMAPMPRWIGRASGGQLWKQHSAEMNPEFVAYVNAMIEKAGN